MATHEIKADLDVDGEVQGTSLDINGNADISGNLSGVDSLSCEGLSASSSVTTVAIQLQGDLNVLNKAQTSYLTLADRDTSGSEVVYNLANVGSATFGGNVTAGSNNLTAAQLYVQGTYPRIYLADTDSNDDYSIINNNGTFIIYNDTDSSTPLAISGTDGTTLRGVLTVGVDDTGHDVKFYGATSGRYLHWDESADYLLFRDNVKGVFGNGGDLKIYHDGSHSYITQNTTGNLYIMQQNNGADMSFWGDNGSGGDAEYFRLDGGLVKTLFSKPIQVGANDTGYDVTFFGATSGKKMLWDQSADTLIVDGALDVNGDGDVSGTLTIGTISATNYGLASGDIPNNAANTSGTAAIATTITVADESSDTSCNVLFATAATGNLGPKSGTNLTFNSSSGLLTATAFAGDLTGDVTGTADNATNAQEAATVTATANNSANETVYPTFVDGTSGAQGIETDSGLTYNPSTGMLTSAGFTGALTGNASGSSGSCTGNAATATTATNSNNAAITSDTGNATHFPVFVDATSGNNALKAHSNWTYNPSTETLTAGKLATDVASIVEDNKSNSALMTLTGQGAGNESNISLKLEGTSDGNPIKLKMVANDDNGTAVGAGLLSYDAEDDSFGLGQSSSHNRMAIRIENTITSPVDGSTYVYYEPTNIKAREYVASSNSSHYDFNGDIMRNGNDTTVRGKMYVFKNGTWTITNADTKLDSNGLLGLALGTNSTTHGMLLKGTFTLDYDPGGAGNPLYISTTDGVASTTVPSTSGHIVRLVGYLIGGTHGNMFFDPDKTYIEVA